MFKEDIRLSNTFIIQTVSWQNILLVDLWSIIWSENKKLKLNTKLCYVWIWVYRTRLVMAPKIQLSETSLWSIKVIWGAKSKSAFILRLGRSMNMPPFTHFKSVSLVKWQCVCVCMHTCMGTDMLHHCNPTILPHLSLYNAGYQGQLAFTR